MMTVLQMLHEIEKKKVIYDIHYCRAGIGFMFYDRDRINHPTPDPDNASYPLNWREGLYVEKYYPTFEEAAEAEYEKLEDMIKKRNG